MSDEVIKEQAKEIEELKARIYEYHRVWLIGELDMRNAGGVSDRTMSEIICNRAEITKLREALNIARKEIQSRDGDTLPMDIAAGDACVLDDEALNGGQH